jgi:hypothetical protein
MPGENPELLQDGDTVTIEGAFFGLKRGEVSLAYLEGGAAVVEAAKVVDWCLDAIRFELPAGLAGNQASRDCPYAVIYDFGGFYPPVEPTPVLNEARAGSAVPLKFSLTGDQGLDAIASEFPASQPVACGTIQPTGPAVAIKAAGRSGLAYDGQSDWYNTARKTAKAWAGTCRVLSLGLSDGTAHRAYFKFQ